MQTTFNQTWSNYTAYYPGIYTDKNMVEFTNAVVTFTAYRASSDSWQVQIQIADIPWEYFTGYSEGTRTYNFLSAITGTGGSLKAVHEYNITRFRSGPNWTVAGKWRAPLAKTFAADGANARKVIRISWAKDTTFSRFDGYSIEIKKADQVVYSVPITKSANLYHDIPAQALQGGEHQVFVTTYFFPIANNTNDGNSFTNTTPLTLNLVAEYPTISNLTPSGNLNGANPIVLNWQSTLQESYRVEVRAENKLVYTATGGTETTHTIPANAIYNGECTIKVIAENVRDGATASASIEVLGTVNNNPKILIISLEPNDTTRNAQLPITISWATLNQKTYTLTVSDSTGQVGQFTGTTETSLILPPNYLQSGTVTTELTITNLAYGETVTASKTSTFEVYAAPPAPIFTPQELYATGLPTFEWTGGNQLAYQLRITKMDDTQVYNSGIVESTARAHTITTALENETFYKVYVKIRNAQNLWSNEGMKEIETSFALVAKPTLTINNNLSNGSVIINVSNEENAEFKTAQLYRARGSGKFELIAYNIGLNAIITDYFVAGGAIYRYKAIAIAQSEGRTESDIKETTLEVKHFMIANASNMNDRMILKFNYDISIEHKKDKEFPLYLGNKQPSVEVGDADYKIMPVSFDMYISELVELQNMESRAPVLFYRDNRGNAFFCNITNLSQHYVFQIPDYVEVKFTLVEIEKTSAAINMEG